MNLESEYTISYKTFIKSLKDNEPQILGPFLWQINLNEIISLYKSTDMLPDHQKHKRNSRYKNFILYLVTIAIYRLVEIKNAKIFRQKCQELFSIKIFPTHYIYQKDKSLLKKFIRCVEEDIELCEFITYSICTTTIFPWNDNIHDNLINTLTNHPKRLSNILTKLYYYTQDKYNDVVAKFCYEVCHKIRLLQKLKERMIKQNKYVEKENNVYDYELILNIFYISYKILKNGFKYYEENDFCDTDNWYYFNLKSWVKETTTKNIASYKKYYYSNQHTLLGICLRYFHKNKILPKNIPRDIKCYFLSTNI